MSAPHINDFASEILAYIFELRQDGGPYDGSALLQMASVCKHWKETVFTHPQLWTTLQCHLPEGTGSMPWEKAMVTFVNRIARWFGRAGHLPLALDISFTVFSDRGGRALAEFIAGCSKWRSLRFTDRREDPGPKEKWRWWLGIILAGERRSDPEKGNACWPNLEALHIDASGTWLTREDGFVLPLQSVAPNLRSLSIAMLSVNDTNTVLSAVQSIPWATLTEFTFCGRHGVFQPSFPVYILEHAPNLERLTVTISGMRESREEDMGFSSGPAPSTFYSDSNPLVHERLRHLSLDFRIGLQESFLKKTRLPALRSVELNTDVWFSHSFMAALQDLCQDPEFWPHLNAFKYAALDGCGFSVREGDVQFDMFKQGPLSWWGWMHGWRLTTAISF
jgi:hypothetical protein